MHCWVFVSLAGEWGSGHVPGLQISPHPCLQRTRGPLHGSSQKEERRGFPKDEAQVHTPDGCTITYCCMTNHLKFRWLKWSPFDLLTVLWVSDPGWVLLSTAAGAHPGSATQPQSAGSWARAGWPDTGSLTCLAPGGGLLAGPRDSSGLTQMSSRDTYGPKGSTRKLTCLFKA